MLLVFCSLATSENLFPEGTFADWPKGWENIPAKSKTTFAEHCEYSLRDETGGVKLSSSSPTKSNGQIVDWATVTFRSKTLGDLKSGDIVRVRARVNIPADLKHTQRGLFLQVAAKGPGNKKWTAWSAAQPVEINCNKATDGWEEIDIERMYLGAPGKLYIRLGLCGIGSAYIDDISVVIIRPRQ